MARREATVQGTCVASSESRSESELLQEDSCRRTVVRPMGFGFILILKGLSYLASRSH
jgi:hypothetical protein